jgi:NAD(P)-dependent dehydrogenase (short-subunit alcohol dehydrogenase family)
MAATTLDQQIYTTKLSNARVLITGGTSGLGFGLAAALLEHGAIVTISSSQQRNVDSAISRLKSAYPSRTSNIHGIVCDLGSEDSLEENVAELMRAVGKLDHIVHTSGDALAHMELRELSMPKLVKAGLVRYFAPMFIAKYAQQLGTLPASPNSSITLTTGSISQRPISNWGPVASYAAGLHGMTRQLALDLKPVRVNLVSPGVVDTELWKEMSESEKEIFFSHMREKSTTGEVGRVEDVVEAYLYVLKDRNVSGTVVSTNSGTLLL